MPLSFNTLSAGDGPRGPSAAPGLQVIRDALYIISSGFLYSL
jgi:hypothetical protein